MQDNSAVRRIYDHVRDHWIVFRTGWIENFRSRKVGRQWVLSNDAGAWMLLSEEQLQEVRSIAMQEELFLQLEGKHLILTADNTATYFQTYARWSEPHIRHPVHHIIVSTVRCNLACKYCHVAVVAPNAGKQYDLTIETAEAILEFASLSKAKEQSFEFQGGESLLNQDVLFAIIPKIRFRYEQLQRSIYISIQTNATLLTESFVAFCKKYQVHIGSSLDGPKDLHDSQRPFWTPSESIAAKSSYERVSEVARKFDIPTLPTITGASLPRWREVIDSQLSGGSDVVAFQPVFPINSALKNWNEVGVMDDEFVGIYSEVVCYLKSKWSEERYPLERRVRLALRKLLTGRDVDFADFGNPCGMVHSQITYNYNGDIFTCDEGRDFPEFKIGNVKESIYDDVVFGQATRNLKSLSLHNDTECQTCAYKAYCGACPVHSRAVNGTLVSKHAGSLYCKMTMFIFDTLFLWESAEPGLLKRVGAAHGIR